jgi:hypothetical protein
MRTMTSAPTFLAAVAAVLLPISAARAEIPRVAPRTLPTALRPPLDLTPAFDLSVVGGDTQISQGIFSQASATTATFAVTLKNLGTQTVTGQNVGCRLAAVDFVNVASTLTLKQGEQGRVVVATKTPWTDIPSGFQTIKCAAAITQPSQAKDANSANDTWSGTVMARPIVVATSDLQPKTATLRNCLTHAAPTVGGDTCVELEYANVGEDVTQTHYIECKIERTAPSAQTGPTTRLKGLVPFPAGGTTTASLNMGPLSLGQHRATCTLDSTKDVPETNEGNNTIVAISQVTEPDYDIGVASVDASMRSGEDSGDAAKFNVLLRNGGTKDITKARVACTFGPASEKLPVVDTGSSPIKSQASKSVVVALSTYPKYVGVQPLKCSVSIVLPSGATDQVPKNNLWTGTIRVP